MWVNYFDYDRVYFPLNLNKNHWVCYVADMKNRIIYYYDPLGGTPKQAYQQILMRFFLDEYNRVFGHVMPEHVIGQWSLLPKKCRDCLSKGISTAAVYTCAPSFGCTVSAD